MGPLWLAHPASTFKCRLVGEADPIAGSHRRGGRGGPHYFSGAFTDRSENRASGNSSSSAIANDFSHGVPGFSVLMSKASLVLTDPAAYTKQTTALGVPCLTLLENTEPPVTISDGTNHLVGTDPAKIIAAA